MNKDYFKRLARNLASRYTREELAQLLIKNKDRRISNLIASAYNIKIMSTEKTLTTQVVSFDFYEYMNRTFGPDSWIYKYLSKKEWNNFKGLLIKHPDEQSRDRAILFFYTKWKDEIRQQKMSDMRRCIYLDEKREAELKSSKKKR